MKKLALIIPALLLIGACGVGAGSQDGGAAPMSAYDGGTSAGEVASPPSAKDGSAGTPDGSLTSDRVGPNRAPVQERAVISTGQLEVATKNVDRTRLSVLQLVDGWQGLVSDEQSTADRAGRTDSVRMVLRVPSTSFGTAMTELGKLGKVLSRGTTSKDVTTDVIDTDVRIRAQRKSLQRVEQLLARATTIGEIMSIEAQLTQRQQELDSLEAQQAWLTDQTSLSTVTLLLHRTAHHAAPPKDDDHGFLAGFRKGWHGLQSATVATLTVVGAVLPFALLATLLLVPLAWGARRVRRTPPSPNLQPPAPAA